jgi:tRNA-dihydrouridine synthase
MNLYFAPLEGITTKIYRNTHYEFFGNCDGYYSPFLTPGNYEKVTTRLLKDVMKEDNKVNSLTVQVLTNNSETFLAFANKLKAIGYDEVNINLGCPSGTVVGKGRGSGMLKDPDFLDKFLYEIFSKTPIKVSLKTRIGFLDYNEYKDLFKVYEKYSPSLLIVHPRTRKELYNGNPHKDIFKEIYLSSNNRLCYNGDIYSLNDYEDIKQSFPALNDIMIGRGAIKNPALFREIKGGEKLTTRELIDFTVLLKERYMESLKSPVFTLHKLKEIWMYSINNYPEEKKIFKAIKKATRLDDFMENILSLPEIK